MSFPTYPISLSISWNTLTNTSYQVLITVYVRPLPSLHHFPSSITSLLVGTLLPALDSLRHPRPSMWDQSMWLKHTCDHAAPPQRWPITWWIQGPNLPPQSQPTFPNLQLISPLYTHHVLCPIPMGSCLSDLYIMVHFCVQLSSARWMTKPCPLLKARYKCHLLQQT